MAKISVIVPIYNIEMYLPKCLSSICNQSFSDLEIILVDDGSTDNSGKICDEYALKDSRVTVIHKENEGLVRARKTGISIASGDYATYVDGDDWIDIGAYESMLNDMTQNEVDIVFCEHFESIADNDVLIHNSVRSGYYDRAAMEKELFPYMVAGEHLFEWRLYTSVWDALFDRELLEKVQMLVDDQLTIGEDIACVYPALFEADSVFFSQKAFYHYRQSPYSMVKKIVDKDIERKKYSRLFLFVKTVLRKYNLSEDIYRQWEDFLLFLMVPRADNLYDGFEELEYLFPFRNIKKGMRIAIYCAGTYGQRLYTYLKRTNIVDVVLWVDRNYLELRKFGMPVSSPNDLTNCEIDAVVIATMFYNSRTNIKKFLDSLGISVPIGIIDEEFLRSREVKRGFRLD